jgi:DHA1 family inner membrane transport protein
LTQPITSPIRIIRPPARAKKPTGPFPWGSLLVLSSAVFLSVTAEMLPMGLLPEMSRDLDVPESQIGLLVSIFAFAVVLTSIPLGHLTRRRQRHRLIVAVIFVIALASAATALAPNFEFMAVVRAIGGMAHGLFWAVMGAYAGYLVPREFIGRAVAITTGGGTLAFVIGVPLGTFIGQAIGWRAAFGTIAALCLIGAVSMLWLLPRVDRVVPSRAEESLAKAAKARGEHVRDATLPAIALTCLLATVIMTGHYAYYTFIAPFLMGQVGVRSEDLAPLLALYGVAGAGGLIIAGTVFGRRNTLGLAMGIAVTAAMVLLMALFAGNPLIAVGSFVLWGLMFGMLPPLLGTRLLHVASLKSRDAASAYYATAFNIGIGGGALLGAVVFEQFGLAALPVTYLATLVLGGSVLAVSIVRERRLSR